MLVILAVHGDIISVRTYLLKMVEIYENIDWRKSKDFSMIAGISGIPALISSYSGHAGLSDVMLRLLQAMRLTSFSEIEEAAKLMQPMFDGAGEYRSLGGRHQTQNSTHRFRMGG